MRHLPILAALIATLASTLAAHADPPADRITASSTHPQYWSRGGENVLLLGGSKEDNLFQIPDLEEHLDLLAASGGNYVRCTMSSRDERNVWPFHYDEEEDAYDLARWNDEYWARFERLLAEADRRGIVVQVEIWATFDFYRDNWNVNPFNPKNNVNYTAERTKLLVEVPTHPVYCDNRFFWSVPDHDNNMPVLQFQQRFVDKLLSYTLDRGNVLYCMDNETSVTAAWGRFWATYIKKKAAEAGVSVETTEMWDPWDLDHISHRESFDHPETYSFVDISQNNHQRGQAHWAGGVRQIERLRKAGNLRPVTNVKTYGSDGGRHGGDTNEAVAKFIRSAFFGAAAVRFHRPPSGIGLSETAQAVIRGVRDLSDRMAWFDAAPHNDLLGEREENEAYCRARPGHEYAVYFPDGGSVTLDLSALEGDTSLTWLEVLEGRWTEPGALERGDTIRLSAPGAGHWIALVKQVAGTSWPRSSTNDGPDVEALGQLRAGTPIVRQQASAWLRSLYRTDGSVLAWWAAPVECESAISRLEREGRLQPRSARAARQRLGRFAATWHARGRGEQRSASASVPTPCVTACKSSASSALRRSPAPTPSETEQSSRRRPHSKSRNRVRRR